MVGTGWHELRRQAQHQPHAAVLRQLTKHSHCGHASTHQGHCGIAAEQQARATVQCDNAGICGPG